ncbi:MAG: DEAD/DEAH box helicase family protein [Flavobacteriales bacterium]|nr:DEAD/DEAH box helicase family protein [Flavobacteriales bacterium]
MLALGEKWQKVDNIRLLMGDEVSLRTKRAFEQGLKKIEGRLDGSLESEKAQNDFLEGVPAIIEAIRSGKIQCRVYRKDKFHAKAYITHGRAAVVGSFGLVGSSNFTFPGMADNVELNVQIRGPEVGILQEWYEGHWKDAEDVTADVLRTLERHVVHHTPFKIWFKSLDEYFRGQSLTPDLWDTESSSMFKILDKYQQDAYKNLVKICKTHGGAFLCDGVGLGKTFVGLMLMERMVMHEDKRVVLLAPKAAREDVWERAIEKYLPHLNSGFIKFVLYNHTDLQRSGDFERNLKLTLKDADVIIVDEAHHFRNPGLKGEGQKGPSRYRKFQKLLHEGGRKKQVYFLTATPVNNTVHDFRRLIELVTNADDKYFAPQVGINSLRRHFVDLERKIFGRKKKDEDQLTLDIIEAEQVLRTDDLFEELVVQRSRAYVRRSQEQRGVKSALFPERAAPKVVDYDLRGTYGKLLESVAKAFHKKNPLLVLGIYYPLSYWKGEREGEEFTSWNEGRQKQVVTLIRTLFLKRFESSSKAFEGSCYRLLQRLFAWVMAHSADDHDQRRLERWKTKNADLIDYVVKHQLELFPKEAEEDEVEEFITPGMLEGVDRLDPEKFDLTHMLEDCYDDMNQLAEFLTLLGNVKPAKDDKLKQLVKLLKTDKVLKSQKVILFTEFADTARYLEFEMKRNGIDGLHRVDGGSTQKQRSAIIKRFAPYYNGYTKADLEADGEKEIRVLISTDVMAEGLNLQDATRLINYDLHWNPVRLMQRIGRVDRRMNPEVEQQIVKDDPSQKDLRGKVEFWNFLPPEELEELLKLYERVTNKTVTISKTLGIEGRKLLRPDDDYNPVRELNEHFDGTISDEEKLQLEYNDLLIAHPDLAAELPNMALKAFSGKSRGGDGPQAIFFCHRIPRPDPELVDTESGVPRWSDGAGFTVWTCANITDGKTASEPGAIAELIRSIPDTPRSVKLDRVRLAELRRLVEQELVRDHLRALQAPIGVSPILKCWLELN